MEIRLKNLILASRNSRSLKDIGTDTDHWLQLLVTRLEVTQGRQTWYHSIC